MDYKKKYKEALERARQFSEHPLQEDSANIVEYIFPELAESEDEKVRKALLEYFGEQCDMSDWNGVYGYQVVAWLEKQGEKLPVGFYYVNSEGKKFYSDTFKYGDVTLHVERQGEQPRYNIGDVLCDKLCTTLDKNTQPNFEIVDIRNGMYICDKGSFPISQQDEYELVAKRIEQNPADKVEPKFKVKYAGSEYNVLEIKEIAGDTYYGIEDEPNHIDYVLPDNCEIVSEQKSSWSEEDEERLQSCINILQAKGIMGVTETINTKWLKSLKDRCTWELSDKQLDALHDAAVYVDKSMFPYPKGILMKLYKQLKKLKEE